MFILKKFALRALLSAVGVVVLVNVILAGWIEIDPQRRIEHALASGNAGVAKHEYRELIKKDPLNIEYHRGYISSHLKMPARIGRRRIRDDDAFIAEYERYANSPNGTEADLSNYCIGYFHSIKDEYREALEFYLRVKNPSTPYLNNSIGSAYQALGKLDLARRYFERELSVPDGYRSGAYYNLAELLHHKGDIRALRALASNSEAAEHIPGNIWRYLVLEDGQFVAYLRETLAMRGFDWRGFIGALMIMGVWFVYLRRVDVFEPEPLPVASLTLVGGMMAAVFVTPLYDVLDFYGGFRLNGRYLNDFLYCVLGIGFLEEAVKIVPVLLVLRFTKSINESVDYLIYGSLSGLGFAFMENLLYFSNGGLPDISARAFSAVVLHIALTSLVMYGLFYSKYQGKGRPWLYFMMSFGSAILLHGVYDFWLVAEGWIGELSLLSFVILIHAVVRYGKAINCALNLSEHMPKKYLKSMNFAKQLCYGLASIIVLQYVFLAFSYGPDNANRNFVWTMMTSYTILFFLLLSLGGFEIQKAKWIPSFEESKA